MLADCLLVIYLNEYISMSVLADCLLVIYLNEYISMSMLADCLLVIYLNEYIFNEITYCHHVVKTVFTTVKPPSAKHFLAVQNGFYLPPYNFFSGETQPCVN